MIRQLRASTLLFAVMVSGSCESGSPTAPKLSQSETSPPAVGPAPPGAVSQSLIGRWEGSSTVESTNGALPACLAPFWRPPFTDAVSAEIRPFQGDALGGLDLLLHQQASEQCHLKVGGSPTSITAGPWPYDEFDCALVPSLCGLACHFQLPSNGWACLGTPPEVWILGISMTGTFRDAAQTQMQGTIEVAYDHRPGNSRGSYTTVSIVKHFDLVKTP